MGVCFAISEADGSTAGQIQMVTQCARSLPRVGSNTLSDLWLASVVSATGFTCLANAFCWHHRFALGELGNVRDKTPRHLEPVQFTIGTMSDAYEIVGHIEGML